MRVIDAQRVPADGPLVVASNHISYLDPVALGSACPRPISYMAKVELFAIPVLGPLIEGLEAYPVDRNRGDVAAIKRSVKILQEGRAVGIFPEGGRNLDGTAVPKTGAVLLASMAGAPLVPAAIGGTRNPRSLGRITVVFGEPMEILRDRKARGDDLEKWTRELMRRIAALKETIGAN